MALALALGGMPAGEASAAPPAARAAFRFPSDPNASAERFERFQCVRCHAIGTGGNQVGPNLGRLDLRMPLIDGAALFWNHLPGMNRQRATARVPLAQLTGEDLVNLVAFYTTYQYYVTHVGQPGQPGRGAILFREKLCGQCHSLVPGQKSKAPNLSKYGGGRSVLELAQTMWNHGAKMQSMLERELVQRPSFREHEMADLLAYLATVGSPTGAASAYAEPGNPARGAAVFVARGCSRCHAVRGVGGGAGTPAGESPPPDLGRHGEIALKDYTEIASQMWNHAVPMWGRMQRSQIPMQPLQGTDLADLVAYLFFVNLVDDAGDAAKGAPVYDRLCAVCHGEDARGRPGPKVPSLVDGTDQATRWDLIAKMIQAAPNMEALADQRGIEWPVFASGELNNLVAYLEAQQRGK
jgi:cytochrome c2